MELVPVRVRECACPGAPHADEGDIVFVRPTLGLVGGLEAERENSRALTEALREYLGDNPDPERMKALEDESSPIAQLVGARMSTLLVERWLPVFVRHGATGWNLVDEQGGPVPFDVEVLLDDFNLGKPVADAAADLYADALMRPLVERLATPSQRSLKGAAKDDRPSRPSTRRQPGSSSRHGSGGKRSVRAGR